MFILKDKCKNCLCVPNSQTSVCGWMPSFLGGVFFGVNQITELMRRSPLLLYNMLSLSQFSELSKKCYLETKPCSHRLGKSQMRRHLFPTTSCTFLFKIFACCCLKVSREDLSLAFQQSWHILQKHWFEKAFQVESGKLRIQEQRERPALRCDIRKHITDRSHPGMPCFQCICIANVDRGHLSHTGLILPASGAKTYHVCWRNGHLPDAPLGSCCLALGWVPAFFQPCGESLVKKASCWCVKSSSLGYVKQGIDTTFWNQFPSAGLCLVPF